jgi:hypothetical protein
MKIKSITQISSTLFFACICRLSFGQGMIVDVNEVQQSLETSNDSPTSTESSIPDELLPGSTTTTKPQIDVISPNLKASVKSPSRVELRFSTEAPATILPETFKATYGAFKLDITDRLLNIAKPTTEGLIVDPANLPAGNHKINMEIQDSLGRKGTQVLSFRVE